MQTEQNLLATRRRRRFEDPESIIELLKGTPPPMPSGQSAPQVAPVVLPSAPSGSVLPDKEKILNMIRGATAKEPLTTTAPVVGASVDPRAELPNIQLATGDETRPAIVGRGAGAGRIQTMIDHPTRDVNPDGSAGNVNRMSKKKAFLLGLLKGISTEGEKQGGHTWGSIIGGGGAGGAIGAAHPRSIQEWQRRDDVAEAQGQLSRQQRLTKGQADIEETQAQAAQRKAAPAIAEAERARKEAYDAARLGIQREAAEGRKSAAQATRELRELEMKQRAEEGRLDRESREKVAGMPPRAADTGPKRGAKISESSSLYKKADAIDKNARDLDEHIKKLEDGMATVPEHVDLGTATDPKVVQNPQRAQFISQIEDLKKQQNELRKEARGLRGDGDKARAEGEALPQESTTATGAGQYAGQRFNRAKVAERAKKLGITAAQAEKTITDGGGTLY